MSTDARTAILARVREAKGSTGDLGVAQAEWTTLPRHYAHAADPLDTQADAETLQLLEERLLDYDATVTRCTPDEIPGRIGALADALKLRRIGLPNGFDPALLPEGLPTVPDDDLSAAALDTLDAVLTVCTVAIAETGTIVLQHGPGEGRRALTLVPDTHICLVGNGQVVRSVPQAIARLASAPTLPTTFVSGPSATADIEMTRIKGVHGPRFLHVLLVEG